MRQTKEFHFLQTIYLWCECRVSGTGLPTREDLWMDDDPRTRDQGRTTEEKTSEILGEGVVSPI